jgi:ADP-heptose:LPS heptosyltransferase/uncharacterized coiled-coil protein SlyX
LILFAPALEWLRSHWPDTRIGLLLKDRHKDVIPLLPDGITYLATQADPYVEKAADSPHAESLFRLASDFAPEILVAPSYEKTWLEGMAAIALPAARRISLGPAVFDSASAQYFSKRNGCALEQVYPELIRVEKKLPELEKSRTLLKSICGADVPPLNPRVRVPAAALAEAGQLLAKLGLAPKRFVLCNPAGTSNVRIKAWPPRHFAEVLAWIGREHGLPALICAHRDEKPAVDEVVRLAGASARISVVLGSSGGFPLLGGLASQARAYFGADTSTLHLAESVGTPAVGVFGGGTWPRFRPALPGSLAILHPLPCFGCDWDCHLGDAPCVKLVAPADVIEAWDGVLSGASTGDSPPGTVELAKVGAELLESLKLGRERYAAICEESRDRHAQVVNLTALIKESEKTSGEFLRRNAEQVTQLTDLLKALEKDSSARLEQIETLTAMARAGQRECSDLRQQIEETKAAHRAKLADKEVEHRTERESDRLQIAALSARLDLAKTALRQREDEFAARRAEAERRILDLEARTATQQSELAALSRRLEEISGRLAQTGGELAGLRKNPWVRLGATIRLLPPDPAPKSGI